MFSMTRRIPRTLVAACLLLGGSSALGATTSGATNSPQNAVVTITGTVLPTPAIPSNAIQLNPGQSVPNNAPVGQSYVIPQVLPLNSSQDLVIHANPGQSIQVSGYSGPVVIVPSSPTIATVVRNSPASSSASALSQSTTSTSSFSIPNAAKTHTRVLTSFFKNIPNIGTAEYVGGILSTGSKWITDNHVYNYYYVSLSGKKKMIEPYMINIANPATGQGVNYVDPGDEYIQSYGLATPINVNAANSTNLTIVLDTTLDQTGLAVSGYNSASLGWFSSAQTLIARTQSPPANPWPDPNAPVYDQYSGHGSVAQGWSGSGIWDSSGRLLSMTTFYVDEPGGDLYAFNGADIVNFCKLYGIPYSAYTE